MTPYGEKASLFPCREGLSPRARSLYLLRNERRDRLAHRMVGRQFTEAVALDMQGPVETCAQVLECDHDGQLHDLRGVEVLFQSVEDRIGNFSGRARHSFRV